MKPSSERRRRGASGASGAGSASGAGGASGASGASGAGGASRARRRRGPRGDGTQAREAILAAARTRFGADGYDRATLRAIAAAAGVDVALVSYYFGSKSDLFVAALQLPISPAEVLDALLADGTDGLGARLLERLLTVWDEPVSGAPLADVLRSAAGQFDLLRDFLAQQIVPRLAAAIDAPDAELRATAVASQVLGLLLARYVLRAEPLASAPRAEVVALLAPTIQRYVDG